MLIVDDNDMNLKVETALLKKTKAQIDTASSGDECIRRMEEQRYDVVLLDHMMPEKDGLETFAELKKKHLCDDIPVVILTANAISGAKEMYMQQGFSAYLAKPVEGKELEAVLKSFIPNELLSPGSMEKEEQKELEQKEPEQKEEQKEAKQPVTLPKQSEELIDKETGLRYCGGDEALYKEVVILFASQQEARRDNIMKAWNNGDWATCQRLFHTLKSTSLNIGARELSQKSKELEDAARERNEEFLKEHKEELLELEQQVVDMIRSQYGIEVDSEEKEETLEKETEETVKENMEQEGVLAMSEVMALLEKIMDFDQDEVLGRLAEFQSRKLPKKQADQIDAIKQAMEAFDWDLAQEKTQELMEQLE